MSTIPDDAKNYNFVQLNRGYLKAHRALIKKYHQSAVVLDVLIEGMGKSNALVISYKTLQELTGYGRTTVATAIKVLKDDQWIQSIKIGTTNAYIVNSAAFWTTWATGRAYSKFYATVIVSESEQDVTIDQLRDVQLRSVPIFERNERILVGTEELPPPDQTDLDLV